MALSVADILRWDPEAARDVSRAATSRAQASTEVAEGLKRLPALTTWQGNAAASAIEANNQLRSDLLAESEDATGVGRAADVAADGMESVQSDLRTLRLDAADRGMTIEPVTSQIVPGPGFRGTTIEALAHIAELQPRLDAIQAHAEQVEARFASSVATPGATSPRNGVQAVDNHDYKQDPPPPPDPDPQSPVEGLPPEGLRPPVDGPLTEGPASKPSQASRGGRSLYDQHGGEWRYYPGDEWRHNPHWDYKPRPGPGSKWDNIPIGDLPPLKDAPGNPSIISGLPPWLLNPTAPAPPGVVVGPPQNPLLAPFPGATMPAPPPPVAAPPGPSLIPHISAPHIDPPPPAAAGGGLAAGGLGGLLVRLLMIFDEG